MSDSIYALNEVSGQVGAIDPEWLDHPTFGPILREKRTDKPVINHAPPVPLSKPDEDSSEAPDKEEK